MPTVTMQLRASATLADAAGAAIEAVRRAPGDAALRTQLFQLFCLRGEWQRALAQLAAAASLDPGREEMARAYRELIRCEALRAEVFAGRRAPLLLGQPAPWLAQLVEALRQDALGGQGGVLRAGALEAAPASAGSIDGAPFAWLADADSRLGPVLEAIVNGKYYWIAFEHVQELEIEPPSDLRDLAWIPARLALANGARLVAFIPTRYPGLEGASDALLMARRTEWRALGGDAWAGLGQRMVATDAGEHALLEVRRIRFERAGAGAGDA